MTSSRPYRLQGMDPAWATRQLELFLAVHDSLMAARMGIRLVDHGDDTREMDELWGCVEIVERILPKVLPLWVPPEDGEWSSWGNHRAAVTRALPLVRDAEEIALGLGEMGPTLDAGHLHTWVWEGAQSMWQSQHYRQAVVDAAKRINAELQNKMGTRATSETDLTNLAFSDHPPTPNHRRLRLPEDDGGKTALSMRRGIRTYAEGCFAAIRNPSAHDVQDELHEEEALEQLAAFSVLARWIDRAVQVMA